MDLFLQYLANGVVVGSSYVLVAVGLTLIFGILHVVNFAHGSFYMLGAYIGYSISAWAMASPLDQIAGFWLALPLAAITVGLIGVAFEVVVLRRLYRGDELLPLLASFALVLVIQDLTRTIWGPTELLGPHTEPQLPRKRPDRDDRQHHQHRSHRLTKTPGANSRGNST